MTTFIFPIEPRGKGRPRVTRNGTFTDPETRKYESALKVMARAQWKEQPTGFPVSVELKFVFSPPKRPERGDHTVKPDCDNIIKAVFDSMNGIIWNDDSQVVRVLAQKFYDFSGGKPRIEMDFKIIPPTAAPKQKRKKTNED